MGVRIPQSVKLLMAKCEAQTDSSGVAIAKIKIPSTRVIAGGFGKFENQQDGDWVEVKVVDEDNILGQGAGYVVSSYSDLEVGENEKGWFLFGQTPVSVKTIVSDDPAEIIGGFYLHIIAHKKNIAVSDTFRVNIEWGQRLR